MSTGPIKHEVGLASKLIMKTMDKLNNAGAFLVALAFALIVCSMVMPYYSAGNGSFAIFGTGNTSGTIGCLGSCPPSNKNCIGDDSPMECQVIQVFFILAAIFAGLSVFSWLTDVSIFSGNIFGKFPLVGVIESNLRTFAVKVSGGFGGSAAALVCLVIAVIVSATTTLNNGLVLAKDAKPNSGVNYDMGFNLALGAIFALILASFIGSKSITDFQILKKIFGKGW